MYLRDVGVESLKAVMSELGTRSDVDVSRLLKFVKVLVDAYSISK